MIEKIVVDKTLLAIIIRQNFDKEGANFITTPESPLQLGVSKYKKNIEIAPHVHKKPLRYIKTTQEFIYVARGRVKVNLFLKNKKVVTKVLKSGDLILLIGGGHGFKFLEGTKIIEIKQGPYVDKKTDKRYIKIK